MSALEGDLREAVQTFNDLYAKGDPRWFSHFADDATIYSNDAAEPIEGREAYQKQFEKTLTTEQRAVHVIQQDAQMMGDTAVVMQLLEISMSQLHLNARESTIWRRTAGAWKVAHLNASVIGGVRPAVNVRTAQAVRVLNEKIALVSSQAGVAQ